MKLRILVGAICLIILLVSRTLALDMKGDLQSEIGSQSLNRDSALNPDDRYSLSESEYLLKYDLVLKADFGDNGRGVVKMEGRYSPGQFYETPANDSGISFKEYYLDLLDESFSLRIGKQFMRWGSGEFFNPIDVVNLRYDPLNPVDDSEGNQFICFSYPLKDSYAVDLLTLVEQPAKFEHNMDLPFIVKFSFSHDKLSGFVFSQIQKGYSPIYGFNSEYAFPISENINSSIYGEISLKQDSKRLRLINNDGAYSVEKYEDSDYTAFVLGCRLNHSFPTLKGLNGITYTLEYYRDDENWGHDDFRNYLDGLNHLNNDPDLRSKALICYEEFHNSKSYLYASSSFLGIIKNDLQLNLDFVVNIDDQSELFSPGLIYSFANSNALAGLKLIYYLGGRDSEFGNNPAHNQVFLYTRVSF